MKPATLIGLSSLVVGMFFVIVATVFQLSKAESIDVKKVNASQIQLSVKEETPWLDIFDRIGLESSISKKLEIVDIEVQGRGVLKVDIPSFLDRIPVENGTGLAWNIGVSGLNDYPGGYALWEAPSHDLLLISGLLKPDGTIQLAVGKYSGELSELLPPKESYDLIVIYLVPTPDVNAITVYEAYNKLRRDGVDHVVFGCGYECLTWPPIAIPYFARQIGD